MIKKESMKIREIPVSFGSHGIRLYGRVLLPAGATAESPVPGAILTHGFGADHRIMEDSAMLLVKKGVAAIIFDLRGHGRSEGVLDDGYYEDVEDAWQTLIGFKEVDSTRIALIGHSLGAMSSILAARKIKRPRAIVALSCPTEVSPRIFCISSRRFYAIMQKLIMFIGKQVVRFYHLKVKVDWKRFLESWIKIKITPVLAQLDDCAKLFVFGEKDPLTPYKRFAPMYDVVPGVKKHMLTPGSHVTPVEAELLKYEWIGWTINNLKKQ